MGQPRDYRGPARQKPSLKTLFDHAGSTEDKCSLARVVLRGQGLQAKGLQATETFDESNILPFLPIAWRVWLLLAIALGNSMVIFFPQVFPETCQTPK